ncbi:MAG: zinc ribbon domain-containing protein [Oscillospiraceae bacterium]|nr:zinc ribbon domain-containing protein [Oscillospiraceae bacterium]
MAFSEHPGKKVVKIGEWILVLNTLAGVGFGYLIGDRLDRVSREDFFTGVGILIGLGVGFVIGWLLSIMIVAFGELVENSTRIRELLEPVPDFSPNRAAKCSVCGSPVAGDSEFCQKCGSKIK